jgi:hypothetical protein
MIMPNDPLDRRLAALKDAVAAEIPPAATDRAIAAAIARARRPRAAPSGDRWLAWPLALAASIAVLSFVVRSLPPEAVVPDAAVTAQAAGDEFMPVVPMADIEGATDALVVPARLPRTTLAQLGLPIDPARAADAIDAELLVRRDGSVLAVRFVY